MKKNMKAKSEKEHESEEEIVSSGVVEGVGRGEQRYEGPVQRRIYVQIGKSLYI